MPGSKCRSESELHCNQMGHTDAQMVFNVYAKWMSDKNADQVAILNQNFGFNAPPMPQGKVADM